MTWKKRLKEARLAKGLSKSELARRVLVSPATTTDWEGDKVKMIDGANLIKLAAVLEVSPEWLITGHKRIFDNEDVMEFARVYAQSDATWRNFLQTATHAAKRALNEAAAIKETKADVVEKQRYK